jgi:hypothetical protein
VLHRAIKEDVPSRGLLFCVLSKLLCRQHVSTTHGHIQAFSVLNIEMLVLHLVWYALLVFLAMVSNY